MFESTMKMSVRGKKCDKDGKQKEFLLEFANGEQ